MKSLRTPFAIVWSSLSLISALSVWVFNALLYIPSGFNTPKDALFLFIGFGAFSEHPKLVLIPAAWFIVFLVLLIVALVRFKKCRMFEWLIAGDRVASLLVYIISMLALGEDFAGWPLLTVRIIETVVVLAVLAVVCFKTRNNGLACERE